VKQNAKQESDRIVKEDGAGLILQTIGLGVGLAFQRINLLIRILLNRLGCLLPPCA
jgi:hypothetical protein